MNSDQAKKLSLPDILSKLGHQPDKTRKGGYEIWYTSPFRDESSASFHTSFVRGQWIWKDFGDIGGNVLDFAMRYYNTDIKGALYNLERLAGSNQQSLFSSPSVILTSPSATTPAEKDETLIFRKKKPLNADSFSGKALLQYLTEKRGIDPIIAAKYLVEIHYLNNDTGKVYFAVGIKNENEGYEIRNAYFKSSIGKKGVSIIKGRVEGQIAVFEGFMDFLSSLTYYQSVDLVKFQELVQGDIIIMNSASFHERTKELLKAGNYTKISLYLDNDKTGYKVRDLIQEQSPLFTTDCSSVYSNHKDFNELLIANQASRINQPFPR